MKIYVGKIVNTHGIKGEIRIISDLSNKKDVFKIGNPIYIEENKEYIASYRTHKNYDMITLKGINDINDVLKYKGKKVYIEKNEITTDNYFDEELIGFMVYTDKLVGKLKSIRKQKYQDLLEIEGKSIYLVPKNDAFLKKIDLENKKIYIENIEGLIDGN